MFNITLDVNVFESRIINNLPKPYNSIGCEVNYTIEQALSRVVCHLSQYLINPTSKYAAVSLKHDILYTEVLSIIDRFIYIDWYSQP